MMRRRFATVKATSPAEWAAVETFLESRMRVPEAVTAAVAASLAAGLPPVHVPHTLGMLLRQLAHGSSEVLEVGTLGGVSALWLCEEGRRHVTTCDISPLNASVARRAFDNAGVAKCVRVLEGDAKQLLPQMTAQSFDLMFVDADKGGNALYVRQGVERLVRRGGVIVVDNVVRAGRILERDNAADEGVRQTIAYLQSVHERASFTVLQTVGHKGHDGFCLIRLKD
jgi:predicted O-methyltransferase YrrM